MTPIGIPGGIAAKPVSFKRIGRKYVMIARREDMPDAKPSDLIEAVLLIQGLPVRIKARVDAASLTTVRLYVPKAYAQLAEHVIAAKALAVLLDYKNLGYICEYKTCGRRRAPPSQPASPSQPPS